MNPKAFKTLDMNYWIFLSNNKVSTLSTFIYRYLHQYELNNTHKLKIVLILLMLSCLENVKYSVDSISA